MSQLSQSTASQQCRACPIIDWPMSDIRSSDCDEDSGSKDDSCQCPHVEMQVNKSREEPRGVAKAKETRNSFCTVKRIRYFGREVPIFLQTSNGPCPLVAVANILSLRNLVEFNVHQSQEYMELDVLIQHIANHMISRKPNISENMMPNYEQNLNDALFALPFIKEGVDVNVKFSGVDNFELTKEMVLLDILGIDIFHGWLPDPEFERLTGLIGNLSYNQLTDHLVDWCDRKAGTEHYDDFTVATNFLAASPTQLTKHGLKQLSTKLGEGCLAVLFRNDHFSTITKNNGGVLMLVTDDGYRNEPEVVWEYVTLNGTGNFLNSDFMQTLPPRFTQDASSPSTLVDSGPQTSDLTANDHILAKTLQEEFIDEQQRERPETEGDDINKCALL